MMLILALVLIELFVLFFAYKIFKKLKVGLFTMSFLIYSVFIVLSFFLIHMHYLGVLPLKGSLFAKYRFDIGNDVKPLLFSIVVQLFYLVGGVFILSTKFYKNSMLSKNTSVVSIKNSPVSFPVLYVLLALILGYITVRLLVVKDFPLLSLFRMDEFDNARDIAFEYSNNRNMSLFFLPSVFQNFYRVLLPFVTFILFLNRDKLQLFSRIIIYLLILFVVLLNFSSFKRAPILYIVIWIFLLNFSYKDSRNYVYLFYIFILSLFIGITITLFYGQNLTGAFFGFLGRIFIIEGLSEYLAYSLFDKDYDHLYLRLPLYYLERIFLSDAISFSEWWKYEITYYGTRGFSSIGIFGELWVMFGPFSILFIPVVGFIFGLFDCKAANMLSRGNVVFISGLIVILSFSTIKGLFSQIFAGGGLLLVLVMYSYTLLTDYRLRRSL